MEVAFSFQAAFSTSEFLEQFPAPHENNFLVCLDRR